MMTTYNCRLRYFDTLGRHLIDVGLDFDSEDPEEIYTKVQWLLDLYMLPQQDRRTKTIVLVHLFDEHLNQLFRLILPQIPFHSGWAN